jgi:hypothetical protein
MKQFLAIYLGSPASGWKEEWEKLIPQRVSRRNKPA